MVVIGVLVLTAIIVVLHLLLSRWMRADRARVAARHRAAAAAAAPGLQMPDPDQEADRQAERVRRLLDAISEDERWAEGRRRKAD